MMRQVRHVVLGVFMALVAACNGNLVIHEITPKTIVLVDAMPHQSYVAARGCVTQEHYEIAPLGDDSGIVEDVMQQVQKRLVHEGYRVVIAEFSHDLDVKKYPTGYMIDPVLGRYESRWTPEFVSWINSLGQVNQAGAVIFVTRYFNSMNGNYGPFYSGFGIAAEINCIGIPPTVGFLYANMGADVFTLPQATRKFFTYDARRVCDVPLPDDALEKVKANTFQHDDLRPFHAQLARMGAVQVEMELQHANVLHGPVDACSPTAGQH